MQCLGCEEWKNLDLFGTDLKNRFRYGKAGKCKLCKRKANNKNKKTKNGKYIKIGKQEFLKKFEGVWNDIEL